MKCEEFEMLLTLYLENELSVEKKIKFEKHLNKCSKCQELFDSLTEVKEIFSSWPQLKVKEQLIQKILNETFPKEKRIFSFQFLQPVLVSALALLIVVSYFFVPEKQRIYREAYKKIHLAYSQVEMLVVKGESLKETLIGYKENLTDILKEKTVPIFVSKEKENQKT